MIELLPSQRDWVERVCLELLDGQIIVLRGLPGTGKSVLADAVRRELGDQAFTVQGRSTNNDNQVEQLSQIRAELGSSIQAKGYAQLIIDDYPHALRWSGGAQLQRALLHLLVDGPGARDTGALLTGRWARSMHLRVRGSPLLARAQYRPLPVINDADLITVGLDPAERDQTIDETGMTAALLARVRLIGGRSDYAAVRQCLNDLAHRWIEDLPWEAVIWLRNGLMEPDEGLWASLAWEAVQPLLTGGRPRSLLAGLRNRDFESLLEERSPAWPGQRADSVQRFVDLLAGASDVMWVDRYLTADPPSLLSFIHEVRRQTSTKLYLLTSSTLTSEAIRQHAQDIRDMVAIEGVELRSMTRRHYGLLHDRQLAYLSDREGGVVLPVTAVILGLSPPGSAIAVQIPIMERTLLEDAWSMAIPSDRFLRSY
jgi:hypothetical protein